MKDFELKIDLIYYGIKLSKATKEQMDKGKLSIFNDYITCTGIMVNFDEQFVTCKINENSPYGINYEEHFFLEKNNKKIKQIEIIEPATYMVKNELNKIKEPYSDYVVLHKYRARIQPISGCAYDCKFCSNNSYRYEKKSIELLDDALQKVINENEVKNLLISAGTPKRNNEDYTYQNNVYKHFCKKYNSIPIDIMTAPRGININKTKQSQVDFFKMLKALNIGDLSINLELFNEEARKKYIPKKNYYTRKEYLEYMKLGTEYLGENILKSCIIVGLEDKEDTIKAIEELAKRKVRVILSPYIPFKGIGKFPKPELMKEILYKAKDITDKYGSYLSSKYYWCRHNEISF